MSSATEELLFLIEQCKPGRALACLHGQSTNVAVIVLSRALSQSGFEAHPAYSDFQIPLVELSPFVGCAVAVRMDDQIFSPSGTLGHDGLVEQVQEIENYLLQKNRLRPPDSPVVLGSILDVSTDTEEVILGHHDANAAAGQPKCQDMINTALSVLQSRALHRSVQLSKTPSRKSRL